MEAFLKMNNALFDDFKYWGLPQLPPDLKSRWYDIINTYDNDVKFYESILPGGNYDLLEIGCGTGRLIPTWLRYLKGRIFALDKEKFMLERAVSKTRSHPEKVRLNFVEADILDKTPLPKVNFAIASTNFLSLFSNKIKRMKCLTNIRKLLSNNNSELVVDIDAFPEGFKTENFYTSSYEKDGHRLLVLRYDYYGKEPHTISSQYLYIPFQGFKPYAAFTEETETCFPPTSELEEEFQQAGFKIKTIYGNYNKKKYRKEDPVRIFILNPDF